jgi:hypothetical protein
MAKSEADLEVELAEAKEEYRGNLDDPKAKARLAKAKAKLVEARRDRRGGSGVVSATASAELPSASIGGDATSDGNEG